MSGRPQKAALARPQRTDRRACQGIRAPDGWPVVCFLTVSFLTVSGDDEQSEVDSVRRRREGSPDSRSPASRRRPPSRALRQSTPSVIASTSFHCRSPLSGHFIAHSSAVGAAISPGNVVPLVGDAGPVPLRSRGRCPLSVGTLIAVVCTPWRRKICMPALLARRSSLPAACSPLARTSGGCQCPARRSLWFG
jgi:hypothetical protein